MSRELYARAFEMIRSGNQATIEEALLMLRKETELRPDDVKALLEYAGAYDFLGREKEALPHYLRVFELGHEKLPAEDQPRLYVQLGSTLRNLGSLAESRTVLMEGLAHFPKFQALRGFLALTEYTIGNHAESVRILYELLLEGQVDRSIHDYSRALGWYASRL